MHSTQKKYQYLLWDMDGTVLNFKAAESAAIKKLFPIHGLGNCTDEMIARYSEINDRYWKALERNEMTKPEILVGRFREFFETEGLDTSKAEAFNADYQIALGDTIVFCDDSMTILLEEKKEYVLAAITNGTQTAQEKKLKNSGLNQVFDYIFISELIGCEKPNRAFFDCALTQMGNPPLDRILIIGDSLTSDIQGGLNMGIDTCWYNPYHKPADPEIRPTYTISDLHDLQRILTQHYERT